MKRREFLTAAAGSLLPFGAARRAIAELSYPVHYRKSSPFELLSRYIDPGSDEFKSEAAAFAIEERLTRAFRGQEPLPPALASWASKLASIRWTRFSVLPDASVRFEIAMSDAGGPAYRTGHWKSSDFSLLDESLVSSPQRLFADSTAHVFGRTASFNDQLLKGNPWWRARLDSAAGLDVYGNSGIAVGDIDNDGADEVYVCQPGGLPNRLYRFRPDGTAEDITARAGLDILDETTCALFLDLRNSGHQDLIVLRSSGPLLFLNRGDGTFEEKPDAFRFKSRPQGSFTGMAAADYDRDGRIDLYLCCYVYFQSEDQYQYPAPYHDARNGPPNFLFRNALSADGGAFEDVTEESGMNHNNDRFSFAPSWCDFDGNGWPDLYVANDFGRNNLYRNRKGRFRDEAAAAGLEDIGPGMSASWFDYDGDGRPDLYVSNMWTAAGQRVTRHAAFQPAAGAEEAYRRHTKGNSLYRNRGDGTFEETGPAERVEMGRWAWSSGGFDFDHDGVPEIFVTTGMLTNNFGQSGPTPDVESFFWRQVVAKSPGAQRNSADYENGWNAINQFIRQDYGWNREERNIFFVRRNGRYQDCSGISGLDFADDSRAFAVTDFDGDGHPDILLKSRLAPQMRALRNQCGAGKPAIAIVLTGTASNRDAIGARVEVNGFTQWLSAGSGFLSQHTKTLYFGLSGKDSGQATITWPSGTIQKVENLKPGFRYRITEGSDETTRTAFRTRVAFSADHVVGMNRPESGDTWLLEPIPTPDKRKGPGFVVIYEGEAPVLPGLPVELLDLARDSGDIAATYSLLRRYIFEYRTGLNLPMTLLIDDESRVRKLYTRIPGPEVMRRDLAQLDRSRKLALPFPGRYYSEPHRNYFKLGAAFYWAGYPEHAVPYLNEVVRTRPDNWKALLAIGRIQQESGKLADAKQTYTKVLAIRPDYAPAYVNSGEVLAAMKDSAAATKMFQRALEIDPNSADAADQLGMVSASSGDYGEAAKWFKRAIASHPDHSGAINNLAVLYAKIGQTNDAIAAFQYGIKMAPDDEMLYLNLGRVYVMMGDRERARDIIGRLLTRMPGNATATKALAELENR